MKIKRKNRGVKVAVHILAAVILLLLCHAAASPYQLLPSGFRYSASPVSEVSYESNILPGDLVICDKNPKDALQPFSIIRYKPHALSSSVYPGAVILGRLVEVQAQELGAYRVIINFNGESISTVSAAPELAIYRIAGLGRFVLLLNANRFLVWGACLGSTLLYLLILAITSKKRRIKQTRQAYIEMFDQYGMQLEKDTSDY